MMDINGVSMERARMMASPREQMHCCFIDPDSGQPCPLSAEWEIVRESGKPFSESYTHACRDHVGQLLEDESSHRVYPVEIQP